MSLFATVVLLFVTFLFLMVVVASIRLMLEDGNAVEIDLHEIEGSD